MTAPIPAVVDRLRRSPLGDHTVPVVAYALVGLVTTTIQYLAGPGRSLTDVWIRYDAGAYLTIARDGYSYDPGQRYPEVAWFPGYPMAIRAVDAVVGNLVASAMIVSFAAGLAGSVLLWSWMRRRGLADRERLAGLAVLLVFPWAWYLYGVVYADSLFLALAVGSWVLFERDRLGWATFVAALATAVRPTGLALTVGLVVAVLVRGGVIRHGRGRTRLGRIELTLGALRPSHAVPFASLAGVGAYSAYLGVRFGQPLLWVEVQEKWSQGPYAGPSSWFKVHMAARMIRVHDPSYLAKAWPQLIVVVLTAIAVPAIARRFGAGYAAYVAAAVLIVGVGSNDMVGPGRYLLAAFPAAALVGAMFAGHPRRLALWLTLSGAALALQTALFARDVYLS